MYSLDDRCSNQINDIRHMLIDQHQANIYDYCEKHSESHSSLLADLYRETYLKALKPRMASGPLQGRILSLISKLKSPKNIVEIGTFTGYATLCLAEGLHPSGYITTIEINPELAHISSKYFKKSPWASQIKPILGHALDLIPTLEDGIDLVFIDAKKTDYINYYNDILDKVKTGGIILADNILWDGKVIDPSQKDKTTQAIREFNVLVNNDKRVSNTILPLRDGVNILVKR